MAMYAEQAMKEAFVRTKEFFFSPFSLMRWLKLGLVGILGGIVQSGSGGGNCNFNSPGGGSSSDSPDFGKVSDEARKFFESVKNFYQDHTTLIYVFIAAVALLMVALSLVLSYVRANMFFVFMESLIRKDVAIVKGFFGNKNKGLSLFLFNLATGIALLVIILVIFTPLLLHIWHMSQSGNQGFNWSILANFILSFVFFFIVLIIANFIYSLTYDFASAIAYARNKSILGAWGELLDLLRYNLFQFIIYYALKVGLAIGLGFATLIIMIPVIIILLPLYIILIVLLAGIVIGIAYLFMHMPMLGIVASVVALLLVIVVSMALGYVFFCPFVPIYAFFRYYPMCFLEKLETGLNFREPAIYD
jgi:hypothetical protein